MDIVFSDTQKRLLTTILERGAEAATHALSQWLGGPVHLTVSAVERVDLAEAASMLGPEDALVAACPMALSGALTGEIILVFSDAAGLALADLLMGRPVGTSTAWGDLEQSAAKETANIVGCSYLNALASHLPALGGGGGTSTLAPGPPGFRHEFAGSLLEFALMDQAATSDRLLLVDSQFTASAARLDWTLLFVPSGESLRALLDALADPGAPGR